MQWGHVIWDISWRFLGKGWGLFRVFLMEGRVYLVILRCYDWGLRDWRIEDNVCGEGCWDMASPFQKITAG